MRIKIAAVGEGAAISRTNSAETSQRRPIIAFFDYPDLFDDFWPHYGVNQQEFLVSAIVLGEADRVAPPFTHPSDARARQRSIHLDRATFPREVVHDVEQPRRAEVNLGRLRVEVINP